MLAVPCPTVIRIPTEAFRPGPPVRTLESFLGSGPTSTDRIGSPFFPGIFIIDAVEAVFMSESPRERLATRTTVNSAAQSFSRATAFASGPESVLPSRLSPRFAL